LALRKFSSQSLKSGTPLAHRHRDSAKTTDVNGDRHSMGEGRLVAVRQAAGSWRPLATDAAGRTAPASSMERLRAWSAPSDEAGAW
jgi:hypothetical protein